MGKPSKFFIGYRRDTEAKKPFKIPSKQLLTHAVVLGASGSGKTVLCKTIVEEAVRSDIPVIAFDPKGDIGALGITMKDFSPENVDVHAEIQAEDQGRSKEEVADEWIQTYQTNLAKSFGKDYQEIEEQYAEKVAVILVTPKNPAGVQLSLTPVFSKPKNYKKMMKEVPDAVLNSLDLKIQILLARCGMTGKSSTSSRVVFLNELIRHAWEEKNRKLVTLSDLIDYIENPPIQKVGNLSTDKFISTSKRAELARLINALMIRSVPGSELDFDKFIALAREEEKVPIIVFDLRRIQDENERSSFVAEVLGEIQRWAWSKGGTSRLRALIYFDELYGFMPAGASKPPSKTALLLLIKQARSTGLGLVLATQNPGDLDYRGLSNISTWMLGKLTTKQDIKKIEDTLRANFEASGSTSKEVDKQFDKLMQSIRALQPGEFIIYNTKTGVVPIKSRWLLSLHKGPLTEEEIEYLTLKPPKRKKIQPISETETKSTAEDDTPAEKSVKGIEDITPEEKTEQTLIQHLAEKKPAFNLDLERYLKPKIKLSSKKQLGKLLSDRLNLRGMLSRKSLKMKMQNRTPYYSPYYFTTVEIDIQRTITAKKIPIEINQEMHRFFDLSDEIQWDRTSIEGIYPSAIPPQNIGLEPAKELKYLTRGKNKLEKIQQNLIWYFSNTPFPEAEDIYLKKIREYEREQIAELEGSDSKQLQKISDQISKIEEQIQDQQSKKDIKQTRLKHLKDDKEERMEQDRPIKAIDRSINSTKRKIKVIEERIRQHKKKLSSKEEERQKFMKQKRSEYQELKKTINQLKTEGPPKDLYKPEKSNISIHDEVIYWIPRMQARMTIERTDTDTVQNQRSFLFDFNLYNGNGNLECSACVVEDIAPDYYQELLLDEISPPKFLCEECLQVFCSEHIEFCSKCHKPLCFEHILNCTECDIPLCDTCSFECNRCDDEYCADHSWICTICGAAYCSNEPQFTQTKTDRPICENCNTKSS